MEDAPNPEMNEQCLLPPEANGEQMNDLINNQLSPTTPEIENLKTALKTSSKFVLCPYCRISGMTVIEKDCSCSNITCCILTTPLIWCCYQAIRGKDLICYNAVHRCQRCGKTLAEYKAC